MNLMYGGLANMKHSVNLTMPEMGEGGIAEEVEMGEGSILAQQDVGKVNEASMSGKVLCNESEAEVVGKGMLIDEVRGFTVEVTEEGGEGMTIAVVSYI
jgi:hypothetical protein